MPDFLNRKRDITWRSPKGEIFTIKTLESGYKRKHIGEVKENPKNDSKKNKKGSGKKKILDSNDTFSDLGIAGRDVTLDCLFVGESHDTQAEAFMSALCQTGKSHLRLAYGDEFTVNVLDFSVKNDLTKNINVTTVSVNWHETAKTTYPTSESSGKKEVKNASAKTKTVAAQNLSNAVDSMASDTSRLSKFSASYSRMMGNVSGALSTANNVSLNSIMTDIMGQSVLSNAFTMTSQMQIVMSQAASLAFKAKHASSAFSLNSTFGSVMGSWQSLVYDLIASSTSKSGGSTSLKASDIDNLLINDTSAISALASLCETSVDASFDTRKEAVEAAKNLIELEEEWTNHIEGECDKITELNDVFIRDTGIGELVAAASSEILRQSYELKVEKTLILSEDKTIIELAKENYSDDFEQDPDGTVDYLISSNKLADDNFFLLPKGSEVKIYV